VPGKPLLWRCILIAEMRISCPAIIAVFVMPKKIWLNGKYGSIIGNYAIVDDEDYERVNKFNWCVSRNKHNKTFYAVRGDKNNSYLMHRFIFNYPKKLVIDHKNFNGLDNRKENLRVCSQQNNSRNTHLRKNNKSGFKGVCWFKLLNKWRATININHKQETLGYFTNVLEAALSYDKAARKYFGEFAYLNFPTIPPTDEFNDYN
jgi:hypothetical protein